MEAGGSYSTCAENKARTIWETSQRWATGHRGRSQWWSGMNLNELTHIHENATVKLIILYANSKMNEMFCEVIFRLL